MQRKSACRCVKPKGVFAANLSCVIRPAFQFWLRVKKITREILDYIEYAKAKGCSMTGPEDPNIERLNVLQ